MSEHKFKGLHDHDHYCAVCGDVESNHALPAYVPQVGDRVRVVIEGAVTDVWEQFLFVEAEVGHSHTLRRARVTSIERLPDPLPTTPGSLIRQRVGVYLMRTTRGDWVASGGATWAAFDLDLDSATVLFDAGATP